MGERLSDGSKFSPMLELVETKSGQAVGASRSEAYDHHKGLVAAYLQSHRIRNHSPRTLEREKKFLESWFSEHGTIAEPLFTWEGMEPVIGRKRIVEYGNALLESGLRSDTIRAYLGILSRYFSFVLEHPFIDTPAGFQRIAVTIQLAVAPFGRVI